MRQHWSSRPSIVPAIPLQYWPRVSGISFFLVGSWSLFLAKKKIQVLWPIKKFQKNHT
jgi:hypothetical protein